MEKNEILAVAQGGGFPGVESHLGMLKALDFRNEKITSGRGASAGGIALALYFSQGPDRAIDLVRSHTVSDLLSFSYSFFIPFYRTSNLYNRSGMEELLKKYLDPQRMYSHLKVSITRCEDNASIMMRAQGVADILATSAIPEVFYPVPIGPYEYKDGGCTNNIPTPRIRKIKNYKHIYILMPPTSAYTPAKWYYPKILRGLNEAMGTGVREANTIKFEWEGLPNVTILQPPPPPFECPLLSFSEDYQLIDYSRQYVDTVLNEQTKTKEKSNASESSKNI